MPHNSSFSYQSIWQLSRRILFRAIAESSIGMPNGRLSLKYSLLSHRQIHYSVHLGKHLIFFLHYVQNNESFYIRVSPFVRKLLINFYICRALVCASLEVYMFLEFLRKNFLQGCYCFSLLYNFIIKIGSIFKEFLELWSVFFIFQKSIQHGLIMNV